VRQHCAQCLAVVDDRLSYETPREEILCGPCYFALWGPHGLKVLPDDAEKRRPRARRPKRERSVWIPRPTGELDRRG